MAAKNDITGDSIRSATTKQYTDNFADIDFNKKTSAKLVKHHCTKMKVNITTVENIPCKYCLKTFT